MLPLRELSGRLPADLLTRLGGYRCELPPLRERIGDLGVLAASVLAAAELTAATEHARPVEIDLAAGQALLAYAWPGNIRELVHVLTGAATLADGAIRREHLTPELRL
jgi:anaerobic nitric oxide reductase transcription regulator